MPEAAVLLEQHVSLIQESFTASHPGYQNPQAPYDFTPGRLREGMSLQPCWLKHHLHMLSMLLQPVMVETASAAVMHSGILCSFSGSSTVD